MNTLSFYKEHERWVDIEYFEGQYQVCTNGTIRALDRYVIKKNGHVCFQKGTTIKPVKHPKGYLYVSLSKGNKRKSYKIHRIVAIHFVPNPQGFKEVNHLDGNKENNCASNLEWATAKQNMLHAYVNGLRNHKLKDEEVLEIFKSTLPTKELCNKHGISCNTVYDIKSGKTRTILTGKIYTAIPTNKKFTAKKYLNNGTL